MKKAIKDRFPVQKGKKYICNGFYIDSVSFNSFVEFQEIMKNDIREKMGEEVWKKFAKDNNIK